MTIAITGASGHIGACLSHLLVEKGYRVKALVHKNLGGIKDLPIEFIWGDLMDEKVLDRLMDNVEVVIHLAARVTLKVENGDMNLINADGTKLALEAAIRNKVRRFIHFSTIHAFDPRPFGQVLDETRPLVQNSRYDYDKSKILSETYVQNARQQGLETVIFSPTAVMGPFDFRPSVLGKALIRFYNGKNPALIPGGYNWVDVRDIASAAISALDRGTPGEKYILSGQWIGILQLAKTIEKLGGAKPPWFTSPFWLARLGAPFLNLHATITGQEPIYTTVSLNTLKNSHRHISADKAEAGLGYKARPFDDTLRDTIKWFQSIKMIS